MVVGKFPRADIDCPKFPENKLPAIWLKAFPNPKEPENELNKVYFEQLSEDNPVGRQEFTMVVATLDNIFPIGYDIIDPMVEPIFPRTAPPKKFPANAKIFGKLLVSNPIAGLISLGRTRAPTLSKIPIISNLLGC